MRRAARMLLACGVALAAAPGLAQTFPSRPVKIVVPNPPGGATDAMARALSARLADEWGQPVVVENRAGAQQILASEYVAKSAPDGYTLFVSDASSFVMNPHLYPKLPYDGLASFTPITVLASFPWVVVVNPSVQATTFAELVALAKAKPGEIAYGSFGNGSSSHIAIEAMNRELGIRMTHVPYKGAAPAVTDLLAGQIGLMMVTPLLVEQHARSGKLRLLATTTAKRLARLPDLPTVSESGVPGYEAGTWFALVGPAKMPEAVTAKINADTVKILNTPAFREQYITRQWFEAVGNTPAEFAAFMKSEYERWGRIIRQAEVKVE